MLLQKVFLFSLLTVLFQQTTTDPKQALNDQLYDAVRKGDAAAATAALDRGADVNAKFRYGATALFKAAERGHVEITKLLLDRGADVKVKDTFYQATAMTWAVDGKHIGVIRLLLEKDGDGVEDVLLTGTREGNAEMVKVALDRGSAKPEALTVALVLSSADEKNANITEMLKKAGAQPPHQVDAATLQSYVGKYKGDTGPEVTFTVKDGRLFAAGFAREPQPLLAKDNTTFRPINFGGLTLTFNVEAGKVVSMTFKGTNTTTVMKRIGDVSQ
jgi:Ankyrin repeats (3 copies)